jgi:RAD51-like protein 2
VTFCRDLDKMLGGGIPVSAVTEICGEPGVGKTQFGMQLAADVQIPEKCGGIDGSAVFIDTEGSFMPERMAQISDAVVKHLQSSVHRHKNAQERLNAIKSITRDRIMSKIWCFRVHDYAEQVCAIKCLDNFITSHAKDKIRLVVIDSISFHFRRDFTDMSKRSRILSEMSQTLHALARKYNIAVVMINQMTTRFLRKNHSNSNNNNNNTYETKDDRQAVLVPALGESWSHASTNRIRLSHVDGNVRVATLMKSPSLAQGRAFYRITPAGVRGPRSSSSSSSKKRSAPSTDESSASSKQSETTDTTKHQKLS